MAETKEIKKTIEELFEANAVVSNLYAKDESLKLTKFGYAWDMFVKKTFQPQLDLMNEKKGLLEVEFALTDKTTGALLKEASGIYQYDKDGMKKLMEARTKMFKEWNKSEITFEPYICKEVPKVLTDEQKDILKGIVI